MVGGGGSSGYDSGGNPMATGRYKRDGLLKIRYRTGGKGIKAATVADFSEAYDSDGNPAPPGTVDRTYFKYDARGKLKKKSRKSRSSKAGTGAARRKAKRTVGSR